MQRDLEQRGVRFDGAEVKAMQQQFVSDFPFEQHFASVDRRGLRRAQRFLVSDELTQVILAALRFLLVACVLPLAPSVCDARTPAQKDDAFVELYAALLRPIQRLTTKTQLAVDVPLMILALRVIIECEFATKFPAFMTSRDGAAVAQDMDSLVMGIVDPYGLMAHLSAVESTLQALRLLRRKRAPPRLGFHLTSPLTQFVLSDVATSVEATAYTSKPHSVVQRGVQQLRRHVTPMLRSRLLRILTNDKLRMGPRGGGASPPTP